MKKSSLILFTTTLLFLNFNKFAAQIGLSFNGTNNYVSTNNAPVLNNQARTVDAWIKTTSSITTQMVICDWGVALPNGSRFTLNMINSRLRIEVGGVGFTGTTTINTGQWVHVTAVYNSSITSGANAFLYVNGNPEASGTFTGYPVLTTTNTTGFRIGVRVDGINYFNGSIDEVKVYSYARTQLQVAADTVEYCAPQPGLVAYYKLNEGIANGVNTGSTTAIDYSGFNNNGTLNSFTLTGTASNWVTGRVNSGAPTIIANPSTTICAGASLTLTTNAANNYTWSTGNSTSTLIVVTPTTNTSYSLDIAGISPSSCASNILINVQTSSITITSSSSSVCLGQTVSLTALGANSYTWNNSVINAIPFAPSVTSVYTVSALNACGSATAALMVTVTPLPVLATTNTSMICAASNATLFASGASNYTWSSTSGINTNSVYIVSPVSNTTYSLLGKNGVCIGTTTIAINTQALPTLSITSTNSVICEGQFTNLNVIGNALSYTWNPGNQIGSSITITPTVTSLFTVIGVNSANCINSANQVIVVNPNPTITTVASNPAVCSGGASVLMATGATNYSWLGGPVTSSYNVSPIQTSTYIVTGTILPTGCYATNSIVVEVFNPTITISGINSVCFGKSTTLTATGANNYTWSGGVSSVPGVVILSPVSTSIYTLNTLSTNPNNINLTCPSSTTIQVNVNPNPTLNIQASKSTTICLKEQIILTVLGAINYTWNTGATTNTIAFTPTLLSLPIYSVIGTNSFGCTNTSSIQLSVSACTGIEKLSQNTTLLNVYPNPSSDDVQLQSNNELEVYILNEMGQQIKKVNLNLENNYVEKIHGLSSGIYLLQYANKSIKLIVSK